MLEAVLEHLVDFFQRLCFFYSGAQLSWFEGEIAAFLMYLFHVYGSILYDSIFKPDLMSLKPFWALVDLISQFASERNSNLSSLSPCYGHALIHEFIPQC